ncbi:hypothetical protein [Nocardia brasiliensis]|uniref:hypothetical protein n=1 Tax=Nocardia brasiliensis TaxID=37326 RepID=UPI0024550338|nr:hypothetical protein [Nocardia brasiliensis]
MNEHDPAPAGAGRTPIPDRLTGAPRSGGMVVPYITLTHRDRSRPVWGKMHAPTAGRVWRHKLCQICGQPLTDWVVIYLRPVDYRQGMALEPGMHPDCARYSAAACPVLAGRLDCYHPDPDRQLTACGDPDCGCRWWARVTDEPAHRAGAPAEAWYEGWLPISDYTVVTDHGNATTPLRTGVDLRNVRLRKLRRIRDAAPGADTSRDLLADIIVVRLLFGEPDDPQ